jgi:hypothetical protein
MKVANQDRTLLEYTLWVEEVIALFGHLLAHPAEFFPITADLLDPSAGMSCVARLIRSYR